MRDINIDQGRPDQRVHSSVTQAQGESESIAAEHQSESATTEEVAVEKGVQEL